MEQLIIQGGALGILAWLVFWFNKSWQENNREWRIYLAERNGKLEKALNRISEILEHHKQP